MSNAVLDRHAQLTSDLAYIDPTTVLDGRHVFHGVSIGRLTSTTLHVRAAAHTSGHSNRSELMNSRNFGQFRGCQVLISSTRQPIPGDRDSLASAVRRTEPRDSASQGVTFARSSYARVISGPVGNRSKGRATYSPPSQRPVSAVVAHQVGHHRSIEDHQLWRRSLSRSRTAMSNPTFPPRRRPIRFRTSLSVGVFAILVSSLARYCYNDLPSVSARR